MGTFINKSAAQRILKNKGYVGSVVKIWVLNAKQICIRFSIRGMALNTIVAKNQFLGDARSLRQTGAKAVTVAPWGSGSYLYHYDTKSEGSAERYTTRLSPTIQDCTCADYENQSLHGNGFGKPVCKHMVAVASSLGWGSVQEAVNELRANALQKLNQRAA